MVLRLSFAATMNNSGVLRLVCQIAWNAYIEPAGTPSMVSERGSDKSGSILFARGFNLFGATRELDGTEFDWNVKAIGRGEDAAQLASTKTDATVLAAYPNLAKSRIYPDKTFFSAETSRIPRPLGPTR